MKRTIAAVFAALLLAGCSGSDDSSKGDDSKSGDDAYPSCESVWVDGQTLPKNYEGCTSDPDTIEAPALLECDSGIGQFTSFDDRFFALLGGEITEAGPDSDEYSKAYDECFADA